VPEFPDVELYLHALRARIVGHVLERIRIAGPFLLRSVEPRPADVEGRRVVGVSRVGKRIAWEFDNGRWLAIHLMIAGRFRWRPKGDRIPGRVGLAAFDFDTGTLVLTEAGSRRRASLHILEDAAALEAQHAGGIDVFTATDGAFAAALRSENHTLKRSLTDPRLVDGIGNAYSDEILHAAGLSPLVLTSRLTDAEIARLRAACVSVLTRWRDALIAEAGDRFPGKVTAFRPEMAVHGKFGAPCPACGTPVQRIRYASNEVNYCPTCQTGGKLLADRALSRLLGDDWPKSFEELEQYKAARRR
jgi:formamidopyrimidine-DNA glycosylase